MQTRNYVYPYATHNSLFEQALTGFSKAFSTLQIGLFLRKAGISKTFGHSSLAVFQLRPRYHNFKTSIVTIKHMSPLWWEHINFLGEYRFAERSYYLRIIELSIAI
ncbi:hypothetical protein DZB91_16545 [Brevibacillus sp. VP]|nr:hypothetical protein DZB91_16545 [Brevibacillus sp. VP]